MVPFKLGMSFLEDDPRRFHLYRQYSGILDPYSRTGFFFLFMKAAKTSFDSMTFSGGAMPISLQDQLDEITANTRQLVQASRLAVSELAIEELFATGIEERILPVGATAPEFALNDGNGRLVRSTDMLALGPLVVKFFRGRWCPYRSE